MVGCVNSHTAQEGRQAAAQAAGNTRWVPARAGLSAIGWVRGVMKESGHPVLPRGRRRGWLSTCGG